MTYNAITCFSLSTLLNTAEIADQSGWELVSHRCNPDVNLFEGIFRAQSPKRKLEDIFISACRALPKHDRDYYPPEEDKE